MTVGLVLHAAALGLLGVAYLRQDNVVVEGVYFNRAEEAKETAPDIAAVGSNGRWIIAAALCVVVGTALLAMATRRRAWVG